MPRCSASGEPHGEADGESASRRIKKVLLRLESRLLAYGYRRITHELRRPGMAVNHKRVLRLIRQLTD